MKPYDAFDLREEPTPVELTELERQQLDRLAKGYARKKRRWPSMVTTAAAVLLLIGGASADVRAAVVRAAQQVQVSFSEAFGGSKEGDAYAVKLHETVSLGDVEFVVEDIVPMGNALYISTLYPKSEDHFDYDNGLRYVYANGEKFYVEATGGYREDRPEDGVVLEALRARLDRPLPEADTWDIALEFWGGRGEKATVEAAISLEELKAHTVQLVEDFAIPGAEEYVLRSFALTPVVQVGVLEIPGEAYEHYDCHFEAVDDKGNMAYIEWLSGRLDKERNVGVFDISFSPVVSTMTADEFMVAPSLTWTLIAEGVNQKSGKRMNGEFTQIGESFVVENPLAQAEQ